MEGCGLGGSNRARGRGRKKPRKGGALAFGLLAFTLALSLVLAASGLN